MPEVISKIEIQRNNKKRVNVYLNNEYAFSCDAEIVYRYGLKISKIVELDEMKEIIDNDNVIKAKNDTLKFIERSYKTEKELRDRLLKKGYDLRTIDKAIDFAKQYDFLDDKRYAEMYMKEKSRSVGRNKLRYDLIKKGVEDDIIEEIQDTISEVSEIEGAEILAGKKYSVLSKRERDNRKLYEKLLRFLVSRGYTWEVAKSAIKKVMEVEIED
ncbi:MAG: recombination regulator RecX [Bacillota bacterium]|nr:recombination regulator RecX [Bacillota bacterium]